MSDELHRSRHIRRTALQGRIIIEAAARLLEKETMPWV